MTVMLAVQIMMEMSEVLAHTYTNEWRQAILHCRIDVI